MHFVDKYRIFIDGSFAEERSVTQASTTAMARVYIGAASNFDCSGTYACNGCQVLKAVPEFGLAELEMYGRVLGDAEIEGLARQGRGIVDVDKCPVAET